MATLIRIDRNGTKYWRGMVKCDRCGGIGGADAWAYTGWKCYKCGGDGKIEGSWKEYTPEYEAKLKARREAKAQKYAEEHAKEIAEREAKAKAEKEAREAEAKAKQEAEEQRKAISQYVGAEGDKIDKMLTYDYTATWEQPSFSGFGTDTMFLHCFRDEAGNALIWKTQKSLGWLADAEKDIWATPEQGDILHVKGTIKEHKEYKGEKQTALTRCKVTRQEA